ncbi:hypothetical protein [Sorangium sp. So ce131]|uniref:hypothetical protein n=1 Tax=Sorangium sp. So ce131 TaxID=3133282 RepID=UPI003F61A317
MKTKLSRAAALMASLGVASCGSPMRPAAGGSPRDCPSVPENAAASDAVRAIVNHGNLRFDLGGSAVSSLVYQLDCLIERDACSVDAFQAFWRRELAWSTEDDRQLARWGALRDQYRDGWVVFPIEEKHAFPFKPFSSSVDVLTKMHTAAFRAQGFEDYRESLRSLLAPRHVDAAMEVLEHFRPRFEAWWRAHGKRQVSEFVEGMVNAGHQASLFELVEKLAKLQGARVERGITLRFCFIPRPAGPGSAYGQQIEDHAVVEIVGTTTPAAQIDVPIHELAHYFHGDAPVRIGPRFLDAADDHAIAAFNLLDESLATALQAVVMRALRPPEVFQRGLATPRWLYNDDAIDAVAKALLPVVDRMLKEGGTIDDPAFVPEYMAAVDRALGPGKARPSLLLRTMALVYDGPAVKDAALSLQRAVKVLHVTSRSPVDGPRSLPSLAEFPALSGALVLLSSDLHKLDAWKPLLGPGPMAELKEAARTYRSFVFSVRRSPKSWLFVFAGQAPRDIEEVIAKFTGLDAPFLGLGPAVRR